ncbi:MAG: RNA 2',3'-cyclic phosphodiesterase [Candidatus Omnitrophica bacterium]|nr:RNA 2',3'-cyclic phosphodiesterase [Candidatus Omnitrophota bacterium]
MTPFIRIFLALPLSAESHEFIEGIENHLKKSACPVTWVKPKNAHLTLKFLGDTSRDQIPVIVKTLQEVLQNTRAIPLEWTTLGTFPEKIHPRIVWVGLKEDAGLTQLALSIEEAFEKIGFPKETRAFSPHVTLGRIKSDKNLSKLIETISSYSLKQPAAEEMNHVILYKSTLTSSGPIYEIIEKIALQ